MSAFSASPDNASMPAATVIPVLHYPDVLAASVWLQRAFGFEERLRIGGHRIQLNVGSAAIVLAQGSAPASAHFSIMVRVADADRHAKAAEAAGAKLVAPPQTFPYGERQYTAIDPSGYAWTFSQSVANVHPSAWGGELVE
ncbi:MAG: VOC family protein [Steroidobacter sp.]